MYNLFRIRICYCMVHTTCYISLHQQSRTNSSVLGCIMDRNPNPINLTFDRGYGSTSMVNSLPFRWTINSKQISFSFSKTIVDAVEVAPKAPCGSHSIVWRGGAAKPVIRTFLAALATHALAPVSSWHKVMLLTLSSKLGVCCDLTVCANAPQGGKDA
jgi:hypothetical protein